MAEQSRVKKYRKGDLTIHWEPDKCIHSAICVKTLPKVYNPNAKPWLKPENATVEDLMTQIDKCPSGALSYELQGNSKPQAAETTEVEVMPNGPVLIKGKVKITHSSGKIEINDKTTAFCRCGASANKPYCDGTHRKVDFKG
jgi:uncharacterized Fe-S cluster protein YjdI